MNEVIKNLKMILLRNKNPFAYSKRKQYYPFKYSNKGYGKIGKNKSRT